MNMNEMDGLIVRHLADLDAAAKRLTLHIEPAIGIAMNNVCKNWVEKSGWHGQYDWPDDDLRVWPPNWGASDEPVAWFVLDAAEGDTWTGLEGEDYFTLTRVCGLGAGGIGFRWAYDFG